MERMAARGRPHARRVTAADRLCRAAARALAARRPDEALALARRALAQAPHHAAANRLAAKLLLDAGDFAGAEQRIADALASDPRHGGSQMIGGYVASRRGDLPLAIARFTAAAAAMPGDPRPAFLRAVALLESGARGQAETGLEALVRHHPGHAPAWSVLGHARRTRGDAAGATAALERALALAPDLADAWFDLGLARQDGGDMAGAARAYARVAELQPERAQAWINLGGALQDTARLDAAFAAYARAYRLDRTTFAPIAHALTSRPHGRMWLALSQLAEDLEAVIPGVAGETACDRPPAPP